MGLRFFTARCSRDWLLSVEASDVGVGALASLKVRCIATIAKVINHVRMLT